jgi:hypothetical protein
MCRTVQRGCAVIMKIIYSGIKKKSTCLEMMHQANAQCSVLVCGHYNSAHFFVFK